MELIRKITNRRYFYALSVAALMLITTILKLIIIMKSSYKLSVHSDDINYFISAVYFLKSGVLTYRNFNEATVFIMPLYPLFVSGILKVFGVGFAGLQAVRAIQVGLSSVCILMVYLTGRKMFCKKAGLAAAVIFSFYPPNMLTPGYILTECLFTFLLIALVYFSLEYADSLSFRKIAVIGVIWVLGVFCRPTILLYPGFYLLYLLFNKFLRLSDCIKYGVVMSLILVLAALPWWIRNYNEYSEFIPLTASSGNPMLQGTYINYKQVPGNTAQYRMGKTALETDNIELNTAYERIRMGFKNEFFRYLEWYTIGKAYYFWAYPFYWNCVLGIRLWMAFIYHILIILSATFAVFRLIRQRLFLKNSLIFLLAFYFTVVHCIYMSFDRYAYPIIGIIFIYSGRAFVSSQIKNKF